MTRRLLPAALVTAVVLAGGIVGCSSPTSEELAYVDEVRNAHPDLSVADVSDEDLVRTGRATCAPDGLSDVERAGLERLGIDLAELARMAQRLCPSR